MNDLTLAKRDLAVTTAGLFGYLAVRHGDLVTMAYGDAVQLQLAVVARDAAAYDLFLSRLESSPPFGSVSSGEENRGRAGLSAVRPTRVSRQLPANLPGTSRTPPRP